MELRATFRPFLHAVRISEQNKISNRIIEEARLRGRLVEPELINMLCDEVNGVIATAAGVTEHNEASWTKLRRATRVTMHFRPLSPPPRLPASPSFVPGRVAGMPRDDVWQRLRETMCYSELFQQ